MAFLLYDGECGFCSGTVQFVLRRDPNGPLTFVRLQGPFATELRARHPELAGVDSVVWVEPAAGGQPERTFTKSDAALRIASYLGGAWRLASAARVVPRGIRDAVYDVIARHRHRIAGRVCFVPRPEERVRFLDL
jgi:predicted DCC family thiol-disulfide oxidoreductase YuxK